MKVLVIDNAAKQGGAQSIIVDFYKEIVDDTENNYTFVLCKKFFSEKSNIKILLTKSYSWLERLVFDYLLSRKIVKKEKPDIIISFQNTILGCTNAKQIVYVHQPLPFQNEKKFSFFKKREREYAFRQFFMGFFIKQSIKKSYKVIVQTNWMKNAVVQKCKIDKDKVYIISPVIYDNITSKLAVKNNLFFYPTADCIYKNNDLVFKAIEELNHNSIHDFTVEFTMEKTVDISNAKFLGFISKEEVLSKYNHSILIFPSYIETFGLPLLEARKSGTIILASDTEFSREILADYPNAYFYDKNDYIRLSVLMKKCIMGEIKLKKEKKHNLIKKNISIKDCLLNGVNIKEEK